MKTKGSNGKSSIIPKRTIGTIKFYSNRSMINGMLSVLTWADEVGFNLKNMNKFVVTYTSGAHLADLTKQQLGQNRIGRLKRLFLDTSLREKQDWDKLGIALVWGWQEKSVELLKRRSKILITVLLLNTVLSTIEDLADTLGYKSKHRFREDYLKPLRNSKLIEHTLEKATVPNQQYQITQSGIDFLMVSVM